jgi:hypothetical protein
MNLLHVKNEISELGKTPAAEKMYPITSDWVPITDVLAIIQRFEKHWEKRKSEMNMETEANLISEILGRA